MKPLKYITFVVLTIIWMKTHEALSLPFGLIFLVFLVLDVFFDFVEYWKRGHKLQKEEGKGVIPLDV